MTDLRSAAQQALEAWDGGDTEWFKRAYTVMDALRAALAEPPVDDPHRDHWVAIAEAAQKIAASKECGLMEAKALCAALDRLTEAMLAESEERNFCPRCGKRVSGIHTCTPPQGEQERFCDTHCTWADHAPGCVRAEPVAWVRALPDGRLDRLSVVAYDDEAEEMLQRSIAGCTLVPLYPAPPQRMSAQNELDDAMRTPRAMAQAYEAGWKAALAQLQQVGWMQKSTGVIRCDWGFDTTGYVPVYAAQEQSE